jgi:hypothetical protein
MEVPSADLEWGYSRKKLLDRVISSLIGPLDKYRTTRANINSDREHGRSCSGTIGDMPAKSQQNMLYFGVTQGISRAYARLAEEWVNIYLFG